MFQMLSAAEANASIVVAAVPATTKFFTIFIPDLFQSYKERSSRRGTGKEDEIPLSSLVPEPIPLRHKNDGIAAPQAAALPHEQRSVQVASP